MKKLFLCWMLGAVLFSSAAVVPSGYAKPPSSSLAKVEQTGKLFGQNSWIGKHLRAGALALGILITTCAGMACDNTDSTKLTVNFTDGQIVSVTYDIRKTDNAEVADSLRNTLNSLYRKSIMGDEKKQLHAYTLGDETRIGWLLGEANELYFFSHYRGPADKLYFVQGGEVDGEGVVVSKLADKDGVALNIAGVFFTRNSSKVMAMAITFGGEKLDVVSKDGIALNIEASVISANANRVKARTVGGETVVVVLKDGVHLNIEAGVISANVNVNKVMALTVGEETVDVVFKDGVVGQVETTAYPGRDYEYRDPDGTHKSIEIVGRFVSDEPNSLLPLAPYPRYFVLVTHSNGSELADGSKYFTVVATKHLER